MANEHLPQSHATNAYDLLSEIVNIILDEPLRYNQGSWLLPEEYVRTKYLPAERPMCNTVGCVAGWATTLKNKVPKGYAPGYYRLSALLQQNAQQLLGLNDHQTSLLFDGDAVFLTARVIWQHGGSRGDFLVPERQTLEYALLGAIHIRLFQVQYADQLKAKAV